MGTNEENNKMDTAEEVIKKIEEDLQIRFNESLMYSCYDTNNGVITELSITNVHFENFDALSPVFKTIKKLEIWWGCTFNEESLAEDIHKFTALEELSVCTKSIRATNDILCLEHLKRLSLWLKLDTETQAENNHVLDVNALQNLDSLSLSCITEPQNDRHKFIVGNIGQLKRLKELSLDCNCQLEIEGLSELTQLSKLTLYDVDIQSIPKIESLKTLSSSHRYIDDFNCAEKFPNLENLKIEGFLSINIGQLDKLKILVMGARDFDLGNANCFDHLPNLEQLSLTWCDIIAVKKIGQLKNLKILDLSENKELVNIDELETLKALEKLNLFDNKISDIRVLNKLPNLKQVDLAGNNIGEEDVVKQLDKPEIACFMGRPHVPFIVGGSELF